MLIGGDAVKDFKLLLWLTQLGISVVGPLAAFILLSVWLRNQFDWGSWVVYVGIGLGVLGAIQGLRDSLKEMKQQTEKKKEEIPPISFNDHD